jgi:hypothetical protein
MTDQAAPLDQVVAQALTLSPLDKVRLVEQVMATLEKDLKAEEAKPRRSLLGALSEYGDAPSADEIDKARREAWSNFPREDV